MNKIKYYFSSLEEMANKTCKKTGKNKLLVVLDMLLCALILNASPKNYYWFGFYELDWKHRKTFVTHAMSERIQRKLNDTKKIKVFIDKDMFNNDFCEFIKRKSISTEQIKCADDIRNLGSKIIYKPIEGQQGFGVQVFNTEEYSDYELVNNIQKLPGGVLEQWIIQCDEMNQFCSSAVNIVRVVTFRKEEKFSCAAATLTVAKTKQYANASGDAIFANIDVKTGEVISYGCDYDEVVYSAHPISKVKFMGFKIPYWEEIIEMLKKASNVVPEVRYVGWDVAITKDGPVIVEGNNSPGYEWMQLRMINPSGIGKRKEYSELL